MVIPYCGSHRQQFWELVWLGKDVTKITSQDCCQRYYKYDSRTPEKFKQEFKGDAIVALNSKTYICCASETADRPHDIKLSSKGLSNHTNKLTVKDFKTVLRSRRHLHSVNTGFVRKNNRTLTYRMIKRGLRYFYHERRVCADAIST